MTADHWDNWGDSSADREEQQYWQGTFRAPEYAAPENEPVAASDGSLSPAARLSYANEAIRQKDHVSAGLLAIFLGVFGIHKFYLGSNQAGFIMLAVSIIGGIFTFGLAAAVVSKKVSLIKK